MIVIIDYGMGNVGSVKNAVEALGFDAMVSADKDVVARATHLILPGVGAFGDGIQNLRARGLDALLAREVIEKKKPILGLCLGMQMFATSGEEGGRHEGLGWIKGVVRRLRVDESVYKIPHVGWNDVIPGSNARLFKGVKRPIFYFVHSYHLVPDDQSVVVAQAEYGEKFVAAIECQNIFGLQFHPEKSQLEGLKVLENFLNI